MREFKSAAKAAAYDDDELVEFAVNGRVMVAHPPSPGLLTLFMAEQISENSNPGKIAAAVMDLVRSVMDPEDYAWVVASMREDELDVETLMEIVEFLGEEWTSRPTSSASDSPRPSRRTGAASTAKPRAKASTRST